MTETRHGLRANHGFAPCNHSASVHRLVPRSLIGLTPILFRPFRLGLLALGIHLGGVLDSILGLRAPLPLEDERPS